MPAHRNPAQVNGSDDENPRPRRSKRRMREDIETLQQQLLQAEEARQQIQRENEELRNQVGGRAGSVEAANREDGARNHRKLSQNEIKAWKKAAQNAGARVIALYDPFISLEPLAGHQVQTHIQEILDEVKQAQDSDDELEDDCNPAIYWDTPRFTVPGTLDVVRETIYHLPKSPGEMWLENWFQKHVRLGARKHRIALVHNVKALCGKIFKITDRRFAKIETRQELPEVHALRGFLHIGEKDEEGNPDLSVFFRDVIIVRVLRLMLRGASSIETGKPSPKLRASYSKMWHVKRITPSLLAYAAAVIHFILSCDSSFDVGTGATNYGAWYHGRLRLLEQVYERHPAVYHDLMKYYNKEVFDVDLQGPDDDVPIAPNGNGGLDQNDLEFLDLI